jgi:hypothetical protein
LGLTVESYFGHVFEEGIGLILEMYRVALFIKKGFPGVEQNVGIFNFFCDSARGLLAVLAFEAFQVLSSETLVFEVGEVEGTNFFIVILVPITLMFYDIIIMSCVCTAHVHDSSTKLIRKIIFLQVISLLLFFAVLFRIDSEVSHIEVLRKFKLLIQLNSLH